MTDLPPRRKPYLIMAPEDRIGTPHIPVDPEKVVAIIESDYPDQTQANAPEDDTSRSVISIVLLICCYKTPSSFFSSFILLISYSVISAQPVITSE